MNDFDGDKHRSDGDEEEKVDGLAHKTYLKVRCRKPSGFENLKLTRRISDNARRHREKLLPPPEPFPNGDVKPVSSFILSLEATSQVQ